MKNRHSFYLRSLFLLVLVFPALAFGGRTLGEVCGNVNGAGQVGLLCQGAYDNGNAALISDNNSRVWGAVAVVSASSCLSGSSGACSSAVNQGTHAYRSNTTSKDAFNAAQWTGQSAQDLASHMSVVSNAARGAPGSDSIQAQSQARMPAACSRAAAQGAVGDRIACAVATDPEIPPVVQSPQFLASFQDATGVPLQTVINRGPGELLSYTPSVLERAYANLKGKVSLDEFMARKNMLFQAAAQLDSGKGGGAEPETRLAQADPTEPVRAAEAKGQANSTIQGGSPDLAEDSTVSLFVRVSGRYRSSMDRLNWKR